MKRTETLEHRVRLCMLAVIHDTAAARADVGRLLRAGERKSIEDELDRLQGAAHRVLALIEAREARDGH